MAFAGLCILADRIFTSRIVFGTELSDGARIQHLYLDNSDDIPIFGTSKAHGNYSPADLGLHAYNYGLNGASYEVTDVLLQIELAKPRTTPVILELQYVDTGSLGYQGKFIPFVYDSRFRQLLGRFHATSWRYYIPGIRYFGFYDSLLQDYLNERMHVQKVSHGFSELVHLPPFDQARIDTLARDRLKMKSGYFPDEDQHRRLIAHITEHPQRLFFLVISPYHSSYFAHFENEDKLTEFKDKLAALPNVVLFDWGRLYSSDKYFLDTQHLRREAAADFSRQLGDKIRQKLRERNEPASVAKSGSK